MMFMSCSSSRTVAIALGILSVGVITTGCSKAGNNGSGNEAVPAEVSIPTLETSMPDPSTVLATVNGTDITLGEFNKEMDVMASRMQGRVPPERMGQMRMQMRDQLLENMITRQILIDQVKAQNIEVSAEEFDEAVSMLTASIPEGMTLNDMLAQTGTTEDEFKSTLTMELQIRKLLEGQGGETATASDEEIEAFYTENKEQFEQPESVNASHILIGTEPTDTDEQKAEKRKQLEAIREQLVAGGDFAALASEHSSCPSKAQGGDLGSFTRGRMVPEFEEAAFTQEVGAIGDIVETQFGYHLIKVTEKTPAGVTPLEDVKERLGEYLGNQKQQDVIRTYIEGLREKAKVDYPGGAPVPAAN